MNSKLIGGILLVIGTTIGAGMLALPIATAQLGFWGSIVLLVSCWSVMTSCALLFLEVNLWLPANTNLISMAGATLGKWGQTLAWITYLLLLYSILSAYVAGGGDLFHFILNTEGIAISSKMSPVLFTFIFGLIVYLGIRSVDYVNRGLMIFKLGALIALIFLIAPFVSHANLSNGEFKYIATPTSISVTSVAFGCLMIIPSLRTYFGNDVKSLRRAILIGTFIPLICYIAWDAVIMGVVPLTNLHNMLSSSTSSSDLVVALSKILNNDKVTFFAKFFTSICMATSFLSISLSLSDFLSDGLRIAKKGVSGLVVLAITFLPPLLIVSFYPHAFLSGLNYAGISCFILMIFLPALMAWRGRYHCNLADTNYQVSGGKFLLALLLIFATLMVGFGVEGAI